jgi:hypothetical protein
MRGKLCHNSSIESTNPSAVVKIRNVVVPSRCVRHFKVSSPLTLKNNEFKNQLKHRCRQLKDQYITNVHKDIHQ